MESSKALARRFREVLLDGKWIANTNYREQLSQVDWRQATHQVGSLNTIAALTFHIDYYIGGILNVFEGGKLEISDKYSYDLAPISTAEDWNQLCTDLWSHADQFATHIEAMSDQQLGEVFIDEKYGNYRRNIEGVIEHCYYHLGQISLIRKLIDTSTSLQQ